MLLKISVMDNNEIIVSKEYFEKQIKTFFYKELVNTYITIDNNKLYNFTLIDAHLAYMRVVDNEIQDITEEVICTETYDNPTNIVQIGWMKRVIEQSAGTPGNQGNRGYYGCVGATGAVGCTGTGPRGATGMMGYAGPPGPTVYNYWDLDHPLIRKFKNKIKIQFNREQFFVYCHYPNYHNEEHSDDILKYQCSQHNLFTFNDFSPLSAAMISKASHNTKCNFILKLLQNGITLTEKDILLAKYLLFDSLVTEMGPIASLLLCDFDILDCDVKKYILEIMIQQHQKEFYISF